MGKTDIFTYFQSVIQTVNHQLYLLNTKEIVPNKHTIISSVTLPVASLGRYFSFWAGFPKSRMPLKPIDWWAPRVMPTPRSWLPTISTKRAYCEDEYHWIRLSAVFTETLGNIYYCAQSSRRTCVLVRPTPPRSAGTWRPKAPISFSPSMVWSSTFSSASFLAGSFTSCLQGRKVHVQWGGGAKGISMISGNVIKGL